MFTIDTTITDLKVREKNILKVLFSMNIHQVATPEMMLEDARSYILFFRESKAKYTAYIALHLLTTDRKQYYSHFSNPFNEDQLDAVEDDALAFVEGLGAMIDEIDFSKMSDSAQDRWLDEQEIFSAKPVAEAQPAAPPAQAQPVETPAPQPAASAPEPAAPLVQPQPVAAPIQPQPIAAPASQPVAAPVQPQPVAPVAQPIPAPIQPQPIAAPAPQPVSAPVQPQVRTMPQPQQQKQQQKTPARRQQELVEPVVKASVAKPIKKPQPATGVVSRDREALARLLASF